MNIAIIRQGTGRYLFSVPENIEIKEGDNVKCDTMRGITDGVAWADSLKTDENTVQLIAKLTGAKFPLKSVVGKTVTSVEMFEKPAQEEPAQEPIKLYCVKNCSNWFTKGKIYELTVDGNIVFDNGWIASGCGGYKSLEQFVDMNPQTQGCLIPLVSRPAKVGEWVLITKSGCWHGSEYNAGEIYQIDYINMLDSNNCYHNYCKQGELFFGLNKYLVLDGYKPEPEYYNGKVVCVDAGFIATLTVGKVYEVKDGFFYNDAGRKNPFATGAIETLDDMNARCAAKFIEFKGE